MQNCSFFLRNRSQAAWFFVKLCYLAVGSIGINDPFVYYLESFPETPTFVKPSGLGSCIRHFISDITTRTKSFRHHNCVSSTANCNQLVGETMDTLIKLITNHMWRDLRLERFERIPEILENQTIVGFLGTRMGRSDQLFTILKIRLWNKWLERWKVQYFLVT